MKSKIDRGLEGLSVNFHLNKECNARCRYCFAGFPGVTREDRLTDVERGDLIDLLVDGGVGKINFAGGEPTLVRNLGDLCRRIKERSRGGCAVSIVSNGFRLRPLIEGSAQWLDWVALSLDSGDDRVNIDIGRTKRDVPYVENMLALADVLRGHGVGVKCNTVVSRYNVDEDMSGVVRRLAPERWKLFQVLPVIGENGETIADHEISGEQFKEFVRRHRSLSDAGVSIVPEDNAHMTASYIMIDPAGRFYWHVPSDEPGGLEHGNPVLKVYGDPILEVGLEEALKQVRFSEDMYDARGAKYDWLRRQPPALRNGAASGSDSEIGQEGNDR